MTAINKNSAKSTKSPAPATKSAKPAAKKAAAVPVAKVAPAPTPAPAPAVVRPAVPAPAVTRAPAPTPAVSRAPAPAPVVAAPTVSAPVLKAVKAKPVITTIIARIDVGFGNLLYVRGEGPGLSWDRGLPMSCVGSDQWQLTLGESARPFTFKFLVNDLTWSSGADFTVDSGGSVTLTPEF